MHVLSIEFSKEHLTEKFTSLLEFKSTVRIIRNASSPRLAGWQLMQRCCIQVVTKNMAHQLMSTLSRKALWYGMLCWWVGGGPALSMAFDLYASRLLGRARNSVLAHFHIRAISSCRDVKTNYRFQPEMFPSGRFSKLNPFPRSSDSRLGLVEMWPWLNG